MATSADGGPLPKGFDALLVSAFMNGASFAAKRILAASNEPSLLEGYWEWRKAWADSSWPHAASDAEELLIYAREQAHG